MRNVEGKTIYGRASIPHDPKLIHIYNINMHTLYEHVEYSVVTDQKTVRSRKPSHPIRNYFVGKMTSI